jgi:hypothetical protein
MKVHKLDADVNKYRGLYYINDDDVVEFKRRFNGTQMKHAWTAEEQFAFVPARLPKGDTPGLSTHIPVFSAKAAEILRDFLEPNGELLPITCDGQRFFAFNVTRVVDALDETSSEVVRFSSGRIMEVDRFSFHENRLIGITVFKIPQLVLKDVFVTDPFVERVMATRLKGFKFRLVWSSD